MNNKPDQSTRGHFLSRSPIAATALGKAVAAAQARQEIRPSYSGAIRRAVPRPAV